MFVCHEVSFLMRCCVSTWVKKILMWSCRTFTRATGSPPLTYSICLRTVVVISLYMNQPSMKRAHRIMRYDLSCHLFWKQKKRISCDWHMVKKRKIEIEKALLLKNKNARYTSNLIACHASQIKVRIFSTVQ